MPKTKTEKPISKAKKTSKKKKAPKKITTRKIRAKKSTGKNKHFYSFTGLDGKKYNLSLKQKEYVEYYLTYKGNGVDAIIEAGYDVWKKDRDGNKLYPNRKLAAVMSSDNLVKANIIAYKNLLLKEYGFTEEAVYEQHLFLINQDANLVAKKGGIDMFYKLKGKYAPEQHEHTIKQRISDLTPDELQEVIASGKMPGSQLENA